MLRTAERPFHVRPASTESLRGQVLIVVLGVVFIVYGLLVGAYLALLAGSILSRLWTIVAVVVALSVGFGAHLIVRRMLVSVYTAAAIGWVQTAFLILTATVRGETVDWLLVGVWAAIACLATVALRWPASRDGLRAKA